jgi:biopolymer transport protein ExbD
MVSSKTNGRSGAASDETRHAGVRWRPPAEHSGLDITPMIDITFLLLIFFLVASTPGTQAQARLPKARHGVGVGQRTCVIFTVAQSGLETAPVYLGNEKTADRQLPGDLGQQRERITEYVRQGLRDGKSNVLIEADRGVAYREVARVAAAASRVQGIKLHFAVVDED